MCQLDPSSTYSGYVATQLLTNYHFTTIEFYTRDENYDRPSRKWTISEFSLYLESIIYPNGRLIIVGDFDIHVDDHDDDDLRKLLDLLYSLGMTQHVTYPTHDKGHILDLIITITKDAGVTGIDYDWLLPFGHCSINFTTTFTKPRYEKYVMITSMPWHP